MQSHMTDRERAIERMAGRVEDERDSAPAWWEGRILRLADALDAVADAEAQLAQQQDARSVIAAKAYLAECRAALQAEVARRAVE